MKELHTTRTISKGKAATFPVQGRASASYLDPGKSLLLDNNTDGDTLLSKVVTSERVITIDALLQSSTFIYQMDEWQAEYDVRSTHAKELGQALAREFDHNTLRVAVAAAQSSSPITGEDGGQNVVDADFNTNGASAVSTIFACAELFDNQHVPESDRVIVVSPACYYNLAQQTDLLDIDFNDEGNGSLSRGRVMQAAGIRIIKSVHLGRNLLGKDQNVHDEDDGPERPGVSPTASQFVNNDVFGTGVGYGSDFTDTLAIAFHRSALGTVQLRDLMVESEYQLPYKGTLMVASYAMGHGVLRAESAIEIKAA